MSKKKKREKTILSTDDIKGPWERVFMFGTMTLVRHPGKTPESVGQEFPPRLLEVLENIVETGTWEYGSGQNMGKDAEIAVNWIKSRS